MIIEAFRKHIFRFFDLESDSEFDDSEFDASEFDLESHLEQKSGKTLGERLKVRKQKFMN